jgi:hypothetical protein
MLLTNSSFAAPITSFVNRHVHYWYGCSPKLLSKVFVPVVLNTRLCMIVGDILYNLCYGC